MDTHSVWIDTAPDAGRPALAGDLAVDVAVVGAGIVGLTTAHLLVQAGARVAVIERRRIAAGTTGYTTAKLTRLHGLAYSRIEEAFGQEAAALYAAANGAGMDLVAVLAPELAPDCGLMRAPAHTFTEDEARVPALEREVEAARRAGLDVALVRDVPLPGPVRAAVRLDDQLLLHPRAYCLALARAIGNAGGLVFEETPVTHVDEDAAGVRVRTPMGTVSAGHAVVATLLPFPDRGGHFARTRASRSYALAVSIAGEPPAGMFVSADSPARSVRPLGIDRPAVVLEGDAHKPGHDRRGSAHWDDIAAWGRDRFGPG